MNISNQLSTLKQLANRSHADLQNLNADDHKHVQTIQDVIANRPAYGNNGRIFYATDTDILYLDTGTAWSQIASGGGSSAGTLNKYMSFAKLGDSPGAFSGNANNYIQVNPTGTGLVYVSRTLSSFHMFGSGVGNYSIPYNQNGYIAVDATNLALTITGLTIGQPISILYDFFLTNDANLPVGYVDLYDTYNSVEYITWGTPNPANQILEYNSTTTPLQIYPASSTLNLTLRWYIGGGGGSGNLIMYNSGLTKGLRPVFTILT